MVNPVSTEPHSGEPRRGLFAWWHSVPLYLRILGALVVGLIVGVLLPLIFGKEQGAAYGHMLEEPSKLIIRLLGALAPSLILIAIVSALMNADIRGRGVARLAGLLILNTLVAIGVGLAVANIVRPGHFAKLEAPAEKKTVPTAATPEEQRILDTVDKYGYRTAAGQKKGPLEAFLDNIPDTLLRPLVENNKTIGVIFVAVAFGIALRGSRRKRIETVEDAVQIAFDALLVVLHWVVQVVPIGVFGTVAGIVATRGFAPFQALGMFIVAVLLALLVQAGYYLIRVRMASWVRPMELLQGVRDALVMAFSTASSTFTMPVTYSCLKDKVKLREESASMGSLVGANFNNDGTALYEAMSALFIAQMLGMNLSWDKQLLVVITSVVASVGAAGIPEAGLVTMTLVFTAAGLPPKYIPLLITVDWFLDRCRTAINVMGDCNVSCILDGKTPQHAPGDTPGEPLAGPAPA